MMSKSLLLLALCLPLANLACTDDKKNIEEAITADGKDGNEFSVKDDGKIEFKADIVYFAFDDDSLTAEAQGRLAAIADYMKSKTAAKLKVEGHCDDRGSVEYNMALGQRRAESVRKYLATLGIGAERLQAVSFGAEKPASTGQGEEAWSKNRRAEFAFAD